ncbi:MAG: hypothetical protein H7222_07630 [Methylotenera sp.]|nr:hypothetical protein [Oligoflexia bacterium]
MNNQEYGMKTGSTALKVWISLGLLIALSTGCGNAVKKLVVQAQSAEGASPSGSQSDALGSLLKPQLLPPASESEAYRPAPFGTLKSGSDSFFGNGKKSHFDNQVLVSGSELAFRQVYRISGTPKVFLAWDGTVFGSPIKNAFYSYEKMNSRNDLRDQQVRGLVKRIENVWFIEVLEASDKKAEDFSSGDIHKFELELQLEDSRTLKFIIDFRLQGPLPGLQAATTYDVRNDLGGGPAAFTQRVRNGLTVLSQTYSNPSSRDLSVWIRSDVDSASEFDSYSFRGTASKPGHAGHHGGEETDEIPGFSEAYRSVALLQLVSVNVIHADGTPENIIGRLGGQDGARVEIPAGKKIDVSWVVGARPGTENCGLSMAKNLDRPVAWWGHSTGVQLRLNHGLTVSDPSETSSPDRLELPRDGFLSMDQEAPTPEVAMNTDRTRPIIPGGCQGLVF